MLYAMQPEDIVRSLTGRVNAAGIETAGNAVWTKEIKNALHDMFQDEHTDVLCTSAERKTHEFMLDIAVWNRTDGEGIALAAESERSDVPLDLVRDFEKLLVVKSSLKLMIYASYSRGSQRTFTEALHASLLSYKHHESGERYIFVDFAAPPRRQAYWLEIPELPPGDRRLKELPAVREVALV